MFKRLIATLMIAACLGFPSANAATIDNDTRVALQTELREYIEQKTTNDRYTYFDEAQGDAVTLRIKMVHPVVLVRGDRFLMCADFVDAKGNDVVIDYVILPLKTGYLVEKEIEGQRPRLMTLFEKLM